MSEATLPPRSPVARAEIENTFSSLKVARSPVLQDSLPRAAAAPYIGVEISTLASWAHTGKHRDLLPFALIGKKAFYRKSDLDKFVESRFSVSAQ